MQWPTYYRPNPKQDRLPEWPGASSVYSYLYRVLEQLGVENWKRERTRAKKRRVKLRPPGPTEEMEIIMEALVRGDEEQLKAIQMKYKLRSQYC